VQILPTVFGGTSKKWSLLVFLQTLSGVFEAKQRWAPFLPRFSGILPKFSTNQNFWGCAFTLCTPASYMTDAVPHQSFTP